MMIEESGETNPKLVEDAMTKVLEAHQILRDYAVVRHPHNLATLNCIEPKLTGGVVALVAGKVDQVRLIDNMVLGA